MYTFVRHAAKKAALIVLILTGTITAAHAQSALDCGRLAITQSEFLKADSCYTEALKTMSKDKSVLIEAGDVKMELDKYAAAVELFKQASSLDPKNADINRRLGLAYSALGDHPRAIEALQRARKSDETMENLLALGQGYLACGRDSLNQAELTILKTAKKYDTKPEPFIVLGDLYFARRIYELAQTQYETALKRDSLLVEPRVRLGRVYRALAIDASAQDESDRLYNKALIEFNKVTGYAPKNSRAWFEQGELLMLARLYEKAGQSFQYYIKLRPDDPRGDIMLARAAYQGKFFSIAAAPLERVLARTDSVSMAFAPQARVWIPKAYFARAGQLTGDSAKLMYVKARDAYMSLPDSALDIEAKKIYAVTIVTTGGDTLKAIGLYKSILDVQFNCDLSNSLSSLLYKRKSYDEVIASFTRQIDSCPDAPKAVPYLYMGLSHYSMKRYAQAAEALSRSVTADSTSGNILAYIWLMNSYANSQQIGKAADLARAMARRDFAKTNPKEMATGYFFMGMEKFNAKDDKGALPEFEKSIRVNPTAQTYLFMAFCYQRLKDKDNACKYYNLCLKLDPRNSDAQKNMKGLGCK